MSVLAVAGLSVRSLAEAAAREGFDVIALDLFGDADTRRAAVHWEAIGEPSTLRFDGERVLDALRRCAQQHAAIGWIAGAGFEGRPDLIERGGQLLPLLGTPADAVRRVRDWPSFFAALDANGIAHPAVRETPPADAAGWLVKDANGCGGWHIRHAADGEAALSPGHYAQREQRGTPMSATFIANGIEVLLLGCNEQIVRRIGGRPHVYCGVIGPVPVSPGVQAQVDAALQALVPAFDLRGLASLDFLLDGETVQVLEINPRPPASLALYRERRFGPDGIGPIGAHLAGCRQQPLPASSDATAAHALLRGTEIVYARRPFALDAAQSQALAERNDTADLPAAAMRFETGDPVCSVIASGPDTLRVRQRLADARDDTLNFLETTT